MPRAIDIGRRVTVLALASSGSLLSSVTRTERILAAGATPTIPSAWCGPCPCPAMRLATAVPWIPQNWLPGFSPEPV